MRTLAIGDIHGYLVPLRALLDRVQPTPEDRLLTLGDYVDRGPDARGVLDLLCELYDADRLIPLRGNHDEMMTIARRDRGERRMWLTFGGLETLRSYGHWPMDDTYDHVPDRHWRFLEKDCVDWYETDTHLFVHACIDPLLPMREQRSSVLLWEKLPGPLAHYSGKVVICGHTRQANGLPLDLGCTMCIDTGVYEPNGWLTCLHVETGHYWQANHSGEIREGNLAQLFPEP